MHYSIPRRASLALCALLIPFSHTLLAQIEEVVVTAQKRTESIQDVPLSITALSGDELNNRGLDNLRDVAQYVPNFDMPSSTSMVATRIRIRGIGSTGTNPGIETSVGTFLDGLYMPVGAMTLGELADISSVEILRGPQGTLYGRNTPMGALNITTRKPSSQFESLVRLGYGDYDQMSVNGYVGGGLSDDLAGRLSFWYRDRDGYEHNLFTGNDVNDNNEWGLRGKLQFSPSDAVEVTTTLFYSEVDRRCCMGDQLAPFDPTWGIATDEFLAAQSAAGYPFENLDDDDHVVDGDDEGDDSAESFGASVLAEWDLGNEFLFTSITGYQDWENSLVVAADALKNPVITVAQQHGNEILSQEFRITSPVGQAVDYLAGVYLYAQDTTFINDYFVGVGANRVFPLPSSLCAAPCTAQAGDFITTDFEQETRSVAAFGNATWHISDTWDVTAGLRWSQDKKDIDVAHTNDPNNGVIMNRIVFPESIPGKLDRSESKVTWTINTSYHLSDDVMLFATSATGFKSGGFNARRLPEGSTLEFEDENSLTYEAGIKSFFNDREFMLNLTLYHTTVEDFQETTFTGTDFIVGNAGDQEVKGVEADLTWAPNQNLLVNGSYAYLDSVYTDFDNAPCDPGQPSSNADGTCDQTGERPPVAPEHQYTLGAQWTQLIANSDLEWFARFDYSWRDEQVLNRIFGSDIGQQEAYGLLDLRFGVNSTDGRWKVEAFAKNATDESYKVVVASQVLGGLVSGGGFSGANGFMGWYGPPRVWGVQFTLHNGM